MTSTPGSGGPTAAPTPRRSDRPDVPRPRLRRRFSRAERLVHRATGVLMLVCVVTAACLYVPQLAELVGRRYLVVTLHEWSGLLLPAPFLVGLASPSFRADLRRLNRFAPHDKEWLRAVRRRGFRPESRPAGKFNAGQKVYGGWIAGAVLVMLATGLMMWFTWLTPLVWRTSATFVHDWLSLAVGLVLVGHIGMAFADPEARRGMRTGSVERPWAEREHPLWKEEE
ncbi:formate dehydrogenase subunit gamma [Streptomyces camponoticapitis]|uniref:Formate dehydrogenase subunit gamma n=1 Tax=Streptomyces camponoticapitis TaxID=1616125 RepID=A0ABQ2EMZ2_9ACTN|nr:cytochrome b/b6 domain-containing protein [Streptomyces camponoticapitis]GGK17824.1 formate dehydrogenase subunit gamma [Streptomyces camponoticapitis]